MGLPAYRYGIRLNWSAEEFANHCANQYTDDPADDIDIDLDELKGF
jgi:hypothetical protein